MTASTTPTATAPAAGPTPVGVRGVGWRAAAGTLPYLAIKLDWLTGGTLGVREPGVLADPTIVVANWVTFALDLVVVALALALTHRVGDRLPPWLVLLPTWVGTGFLVPMVVAVLPGTLALLATGGLGGTWFEPWLQPVVYGGFAWQGVFLSAALAAHAGRRWSHLVAAAHPLPEVLPLLRVLTAGGVTMAAASAALHLVVGLSAGSAVALGVEATSAALALAGACGVVALVRGRPAARWAAVAAAWTGSAAMFSWGLYTVVVRMAADGFSTHGAAAAGTAQVTGLLGGFALAVAGMLALAREG